MVAADSACPNGAALVREALALARFGVAVSVLADDALARQLGADLPPARLHVPQGPLGGEAFVGARLLLVASGPGQLAGAALGLGEGVAAQALLCGLWHGVPVYTDLSCARQDQDGKPCQNKALAALYGGCEKQLREMGVHHLARGEALTVLLPLLRPQTAADAIAAPPGKPPPEGEGRRVFITRRDVMAYTGPPQWELPPGAAVTAAAKDEAARRKITLHRQSEQ